MEHMLGVENQDSEQFQYLGGVFSNTLRLEDLNNLW